MKFYLKGMLPAFPRSFGKQRKKYKSRQFIMRRKIEHINHLKTISNSGWVENDIISDT